ncbi:acyl-CoA dehydrogenase family protein [Paeniroseomonas aquatica]|uniref:Acyl-CoA dehydrogenase family protein n=1 Tax=Paeniroseomonas aquatica TaxID=373043 RepID=A0ABT8ABT5_9PROT|nr:acyl-CoA dehydrogenase family protein [Paeniroseomonas aquatica]MDN3567115.1 acyl-CoA dehydrogenase family protein [Paeniroseomonas aquatica]
MSRRRSTVAERAAHVGREVAAPAAEAVDREARFPHEAMAALREARLLGAPVDSGLGGEGAAFAEIAEACHALGQHCANTAMVFAMHQIQLACLIDHGRDRDWPRDFLREVATRQLLLASATTEAATGGDTSRSDCAVEAAGGRIGFLKQGCVISYAEQADAVLVTARRGPASPPSDQVLCVARRDDLRLEPAGGWDVLGMRGTCSATWHLQFTGLPEQVLPVPYATVLEQTMLPVCHTLWSSLWLGIAADALGRAGGFLRTRARQHPTERPAGARRLAEALTTLDVARGHVAGGVRSYEQSRAAGAEQRGLGFGLAMNGLKTRTSATALGLVQDALQVCGIAGYRNGTAWSVGRHLRDIASAPIMVNNDRIAEATATMALMARPRETLLP